MTISFEKQFQSMSILPGIDISWYGNVVSIQILLFFWTVNITIYKSKK